MTLFVFAYIRGISDCFKAVLSQLKSSAPHVILSRLFFFVSGTKLIVFKTEHTVSRFATRTGTTSTLALEVQIS